MPIEYTKLSTAMIGPATTFSIVFTAAGGVLDEQEVEDVVAEQADGRRAGTRS